MYVSSVRFLIAVVWVGSLWTVGYLVAPTLFLTLDKPLAGMLAGNLFRVEAWLSVFCALALIVLWIAHEGAATQRKICLSLVCGMLLCTLIGYFGLHPFMAALRVSAGAGGVMAASVSKQFGILHGLASGIYLIQSLLGAALMLKMR